MGRFQCSLLNMESRRPIIGLTLVSVPTVWGVANSEDLILNKYFASRVAADHERTVSALFPHLTYPLRFTPGRDVVPGSGTVVFLPSCHSCTTVSFPTGRIQGYPGPVVLVAPNEQARRQILKESSVQDNVADAGWEVVLADDFLVAESGVWFPSYRAFRFDRGALWEELL